jgi:hypothetical protein
VSDLTPQSIQDRHDDCVKLGRMLNVSVLERVPAHEANVEEHLEYVTWLLGQFFPKPRIVNIDACSTRGAHVAFCAEERFAPDLAWAATRAGIEYARLILGRTA